MNESEIKEQMSRVSKYRELERVRDELERAIYAITRNDPDGPQGPFTGNTRESRRVQSITIQFTPTRGGAPAVRTEIHNMHIEAYELGDALKSMLQAKLEIVTAEMEKV